MAYITGFDRKQAQLFPRCIEEYISDISEVRLIEMYVDTLDMTQLGFKADDPNDNGRPGYHPRDTTTHKTWRTLYFWEVH